MTTFNVSYFSRIDDFGFWPRRYMKPFFILEFDFITLGRFPNLTLPHVHARKRKSLEFLFALNLFVTEIDNEKG